MRGGVGLRTCLQQSLTGALESLTKASGEPHRSFGEPAAEAMKMPLKASSWAPQRFNEAVKRRFMELYIDRMLYKEERFPSVKLDRNTILQYNHDLHSILNTNLPRIIYQTTNHSVS